MKSCAGADDIGGPVKNGERPKRRRGFALIFVLAASAALMSLLALALDAAQRRAEEDAAAARRIRIENIAAQASAAAEAWFYENAAAMAEEAGFDTASAPEEDPTPDVPDGIFSALRAQFPQYAIECVCYDLHYPDSFAERARAARIPRIPPFAEEDGGVSRAYYIKTSVTERRDEKSKCAVTLSMRVKKSASGLISVRRAGATE